MTALTPRQHECLIFIRAEVEAHGVAPSYKEISVHLGVASVCTVHKIICALEARHFICRVPGMARGIELLQTKDHHVPECDCRSCDSARYGAGLNLVQALQVTAKVAPGIRLSGLRPLSKLDMVNWRIGLPKPAHPETRKPRQKHIPAKAG